MSICLGWLPQAIVLGHGSLTPKPHNVNNGDYLLLITLTWSVYVFATCHQPLVYSNLMDACPELDDVLKLWMSWIYCDLPFTYAVRYFSLSEN